MRFNNPVRSIKVVAFNKKIATEIQTRLGNPRLLPPRSPEQTAICDGVQARDYNVCVAALAGTGKTTTIEHLVTMFPGARADACTLHSLGFGALRFKLQSQRINPRVDDNKVATLIDAIIQADYNHIMKEVSEHTGTVKRMVSLYKSQGYLAHLSAPTLMDFRAIADRYDIDIDYDENTLYDISRKALIANNNQLHIIDFDDMVYLPVALRASFYKVDLMMIDESQDLNPIQIEMIRLAAGASTQLVFVGDKHQAIYGFRGADTEAMHTISRVFETREYPLSVCRRCPVTGIKLAQEIVPAIQPRENAPEGEVLAVPSWDKLVTLAETDDLIICRTTAPLVELCYKFIRDNKPAYVLGREIGKGLETMINNIKKARVCKGLDMGAALDAFRQWKLQNMKPERQQGFIDKIETIEILIEGCDNWACVMRKLNEIFSDNGKGVTLCTCHKSKGLEAERVFIIRPELIPHPMAKLRWQIEQENNLSYVARTRHKSVIGFVYDPSN